MIEYLPTIVAIIAFGGILYAVYDTVTHNIKHKNIELGYLPSSTSLVIL